jgi:hypothetical protein
MALSKDDLAAIRNAAKEAAQEAIREHFDGPVESVTAQLESIGPIEISVDDDAAKRIARAVVEELGSSGFAGKPTARTLTRHETVRALIQTPLSQQLMPGEWLTVNLQINGSEKLSEIDYWRVRLNTGCGPQGELEGQPAAFRGFETADTPAERARLERANSTSRVFDLQKVGDHYELDMNAPLVEVAGLEPIKAHPLVHAVRVQSWEALDEWIRFTAAGRPNKAD